MQTFTTPTHVIELPSKVQYKPGSYCKILTAQWKLQGMFRVYLKIFYPGSGSIQAGYINILNAEYNPEGCPPYIEKLIRKAIKARIK